MAESTDHAPAGPSIARRSLVLYAGHASGVRAAEVDRRIVGSVAVPLRHAGRSSGLIAEARAHGLGVVLPPQTYLNQCEPGNRPSGFDALAPARGTRLDPDAQRWSPAALAAYADATLDAQLSSGPSLVLTPAHLPQEEGGHARAQDLELARATIAAWNDRQAWRRAPQQAGGPGRELYASIVMEGRGIADAAPGIVAAYAGLAVDGFWLTVMNAGNSGRQMGAVARLALDLQARSARPVVVTGIGDVHLGLLAGGVAAVCAGPQALRPTFPPPQNVNDDVAVFHGAILSSFALGPRSATAQRRLFASHPCRCGAHPPDRPPVGRAAIIAHNRRQLEQESLEAAAMPPVLAEQRLLARARRASALRRELGLPPLAHAWGGVAAVARELRGGDAAHGIG